MDTANASYQADARKASLDRQNQSAGFKKANERQNIKPSAMWNRC